MKIFECQVEEIFTAKHGKILERDLPIGEDLNVFQTGRMFGNFFFKLFKMDIIDFIGLNRKIFKLFDDTDA